MATSTTGKNGTIVVSVLSARANLGKLLNRVDNERRSLVIEKRGTPKAVLLSIRVPRSALAPGTQDSQGASAATLAAHQKSFANHAVAPRHTLTGRRRHEQPDNAGDRPSEAPRPGAGASTCHTGWSP